jgi:16S rRNA (cytosine1402-N4)-methyltransferase
LAFHSAYFAGDASGFLPHVSDSPLVHEPVLIEPVLRLMDPKPGDVVLDGTVGLGGHAAVILPRIMPGGRYVGIDADARMLEEARRRLDSWGDAVELFVENYSGFPAVLERIGLTHVDHMLLDLGVNSAQLAEASRGFSFEREGPLDMRYDRSIGEPALSLINRLSENELADIFYEFGQEGASRRIAKRICQVRQEGRITTTKTLARAVESALGGAGGKIHPATRVFQALRIAVNRELDNLQLFLDHVLQHLRIGGKLAVISFHSLEDGLVKRFIRTAAAAGQMKELHKRPEVADAAERGRNPRSRSAKLRVAQRV